MKKLQLLLLIVLLNSISSKAQDVLMQNGTISQCSDFLYDSGGSAGNYANGEDFTLTLCPENAGDFMHLEFTAFNTQLGADILTIYDGDDTSATLIGTYSGTNSPGVVEGTSASGCLTLHWVSNPSANTSGFEATIGCATACQIITASIDSANPPATAGTVEITSGGTVDFEGSATFSDDGTGATYDWNFGDSNTDTGQSVSHTYNTPGTYTVTLTVTDTNPTGCSDTVTIIVNVLGPYIQVDPAGETTSTYTVEELVEDVLINSECAGVDNISFSTGTNFGSTNGIGYFISDGINFPFAEGIVMTTGDANAAEGPESGILSDGSGAWPGDADLENFITTINSGNATYIEFDFVPLASTISFNFLFASDEYGTYQCTFADGFAFLLTDTSSGVTTNLALVPGTTDPVSVLTIRDDQYNASCPSVNEEYFDSYFEAPNGINSPTDFQGHTVSLQASSTVTPDITYRIKLVLADHNDTLFDSAVFLEAGSFDLGGDLGDDITIASSTAVCYGQQITLDTNVPTATHTWFFDGNEINGETGSTLIITEPGEYSADVIFSGSCQASDSIIVEFIPNPLIDSVENLEVCNTTGSTFNLTDNDSNALGSQTASDFNITYHNSQVDADNGDNPIDIAVAEAYSGIDGEMIYIRMEDQISQTCYETSSFQLVLLNIPTINPVPDLELCDDVSNNGVEVFDLDSQTTGILGTQDPADFEVTYYNNLTDAEAGSNQLPSMYTNISNSELIYVRVESLLDSACFIASANPLFSLIVHPRAEATQPMDLFLCDFNNSGDESEQFDLSVQTNTILGTQSSSLYVVSYHESLTDAEIGQNPITGLYSNMGISQEIHARVTELAQPTCYGLTTFNLTVHTLPILVVPTSLEVCDDGIPDGITSIDLSIKNTEISGGDTNIQVTYFLNQMDADSGMNPLPIPYTNTSNGQIVYVRGEDITTGCYDTTTLELVVEQAPIAFTPSPLEFCDPDNDGFGNFMLTDSELEITGGAAGLTVSYHETPTDAENNVLAQSSPYPNIVAYNQTIYVRVESSTIATDCATFVELQLVVNDTPDITDPPLPLEVCDNDTDGFAQFNLTSKNDEILNGLDSIQYQVSYYFNDVDAEAPMNAIGTLGAFINTEPHQQTLWVRVDDTVTGCYSITTLELIVNALPVLVQPSPINLCDYDTPGDEVEAFTLEDSIGEILNGQTGIIITFHESQLGADTNTDQIFSPYVNVIANAQTVFVRAENSVTGCVSTITLDLRVEPLPSPVTPTPLEVCDTDNDGFMTFNLESKTPEILNAQLDVTITYHETMDDANNNDNPLTSPYDNIQEDTQTVYARAEDDATGCYRVVELQLVVFPSPEVPLTIEDLVVCDDDTDGIALFDLTQMDAIIYGVQDPTQFILTYHVNQAGADTGNNPIVNVASYINSGSTIYVRLESIANGCVTTGSFNLVVALPPVPVFPTALDICDDDYYDDWDGISTFDLTVKDIEITGGNASWTVEYYETDAAAQAGTPVINPADAYQNTVNPKTLHVRVTDGDTGCYAFTTLLIRVNPNPTPQVPLPIELCDDTNTGDGQEIFDLEGEREDDIIGGESNVTASYYETLEDAESGVNAIADPMAYTSGSQTIYVRVTNTGDPLDPTDNGTGCYTIVELELIVHPLPEVVPVTGMIECVVGSTGYTEFDLESKTDEVLSGQDPSIFVVTYHELDTDAQSGMNALVSPYTNTVQFIQPIYVNITNTITGCNIATVSFNIEVQEGAEATAPAHDYIICDNIGDNDGFGQFNLSATPNGDPYDYDGDLHADILDGQDPMDYGVSFYLTQAEAEAGEVADMLPLVYENIENPQTIHVRVDNNATTCYALTTLTLQVDPLPIFDIEESYILCVDSVGGVVTTVFPPVIETYLDPTIYSFEWTESGDPLTILGTDSSFVPQQAGTYTVTVTNIATTCIETDTTEVIQSTPPDVTAQASTLAFADTHIIIATATGDGEYEFSLDGEPWVSEDPNTGSYTFVDVRPGEHTVVARDINECGESSDTVLIIDYPKFFTPNGDSHNPTWNIIGIYSIPNAKIYIFDRYGKLIKQLSPTGVGWDGTYNGELLPADDYWFTVEYNEPSNVTRKEFRAHFTLKR